MAIAQMNWGNMRYPLDDPRMKEFSDQLGEIYLLAEQAPGFIWRIGEEQLATELSCLGYNDLISATVSVWNSVEDLRRYTYETAHGSYLKRAKEWFQSVDGPQLVIWQVDPEERPDFFEAKRRLDHLKNYGPSDYAHAW